jgi:hypothetical protein
VASKNAGVGKRYYLPHMEYEGSIGFVFFYRFVSFPNSFRFVPFLDIQYFFRFVSFRFSHHFVSFRSVSDFFPFRFLISKMYFKMD